MSIPLQDTIAALATPPGASALAVVRISGEDALEVGDHVFSGRRRLAELAGFQGAVGRVHDGEAPVDEVVAWVYRAPHSYTGENLVEFSCHGGAIPARRVLEALWGAGARPATPGEFTRRAFLNGRIDLAQAEAVADLIAARGRRAQAQALAHLEGGLSRRVHEIAERVRGVQARIVVYLDFDEDVPEPPDTEALIRELDAARERLQHLVASHAPSRRARDGMTVALVGRPNVGKSSLLNALAGYDRALVHEAPGTTRDVVDAVVEWAGIPVRLVDTAGLRTGEHPVEAAGIERARRELSRADLLLWVLDGSAPPTAEDLALGKGLAAGRVHIVLNKSDLGTSDTAWSTGTSPRGVHHVSAKTLSGMGGLKGALEAELVGDVLGAIEAEDIWVANERHAHLLGTARDALERAAEVLRRGEPAELGAADLNRCLEALGTLVGRRAGEDLLDSIFSNFCIGK